MIESRERVLLLLIAIVLGIIVLQNPPVIETVSVVTKVEKNECAEVPTTTGVVQIDRKEAVIAPEPWLVQSRVNKTIERLDKFIKIPELEKAALVEKLTVLAQSGTIKREDVVGALTADTAKQLTEKLNAVEKFSEEEERNKNLFYLSRLLNLTPQQENLLSVAFDEVQKIIKQERDKAFIAQRDLMAKHGSDGMKSMAEKFAAMEELIKSVDQMEKGLLKEKSVTIFSEAQFAEFNNWLEKPRESWVW